MRLDRLAAMVLSLVHDLRSPHPRVIDGVLERAERHHGWALALLLVLALATFLPGFATLPPMDRDEPRFAQASKQMLETGDVVDIRLQAAARYKKPVGIYWLQAGAVSLAGALGAADARNAIAFYRLPSLAGALAAVLLTYWAALALVSRRGAVLAGVAFSGTLLLVTEAHLAKTDAVLLATTVAVMGALGRVWMGRRGAPPRPAVLAVFWTAMAVGILVKGPITPMLPIFAAVVLSVREGSARWLVRLRALPGLLWCLLLVAPWFVLILKNAGGAFLTESVAHDMAGKVVAAQESHGAPPGSYLLAFLLTGWPLAPLVALAMPAAWRDRRGDATLFLLAWLVPAWLLFEALPTKLPHYVLPTFPALAILAMRGLDAGGPVRGWRLWLYGALLALPPALVPVLLALAGGKLASTLTPTTMALAAGAVLAAAAMVALAVRAMAQGRIGAAAGAGWAAAFVIYVFVFGWFLRPDQADLLALAPRLAAAGRGGAGPACPNPAFANAGDREPSLVFSTRTDLVMTDGAGAAEFLGGGPCRVALVVQGAEHAFARALDPEVGARLATRIVGVNLNGGKRLDFGVYVRGAATP